MRLARFACPLALLLSAAAADAHAGPIAVALEWSAQPRLGRVELFDADPGLPQPAYLTGLLVGAGDLYLVADADHQRVYTGSPGGDFLRTFDTTDRAVQTIPGLGLDNGPFAIHPNGRRIYVVNIPGREVVVLDRGGGLLARLAVADPGHPDDTPESIVALPDGTALYVVSHRGRLYRIDAATEAVTAVADLGGYASSPPLVASPDSDALFLAQGAWVLRYALATGATTLAQAAANTAYVSALAITPDAATLYVTSGEGPGTSTGANRLYRLDAATLSGTWVAVNHFPKALAVQPDARVDAAGRMIAHTIYLALGSRLEISVMNGLTFAWRAPIATTLEPAAIAFAETPSLARPRSAELARSAGPLSRAEYLNLAYADVTGDGLDDVCARVLAPASGVPGIYCAVNLGRRFGGFYNWSPGFAADWDASESFWSTIRYPDVNGDGHKDICGRFSDGVRCALSWGQTRFLAPQVWLPALADGSGTAWWLPQYYQTIQFADLDADGDDDLCVRAPSGIRCALSTGRTFGPLTDWRNGDFDDADEWDASPAYWSTIRLARVDGDARPDVCGRGINGVICALNTGGGFGAPRTWDGDLRDTNGWNRPEYYRTIQFADVDGDGMQDLCARGSAGVHCDRSTGLAFSRAASATDFSDAAGWNAERHYKTIRVVDVDGDGLADACGRGAGGLRCQRLQVVSGALQFRAPEFRVANFGDNYGWGAAEELWATVQPARLDRASGVEFCGRGDTGILCSDM